MTPSSHRTRMRSPTVSNLVISSSSTPSPQKSILDGRVTLTARGCSNPSLWRLPLVGRAFPLTTCEYLFTVFLHESMSADRSRLMPEVPRLFDIFHLIDSSFQATASRPRCHAAL